MSLPENEAIWKIRHSEKEGLKKIWADRKKVKKVQASKKTKAAPLIISAAHSSRLTLL